MKHNQPTPSDSTSSDTVMRTLFGDLKRQDARQAPTFEDLWTDAEDQLVTPKRRANRRSPGFSPWLVPLGAFATVFAMAIIGTRMLPDASPSPTGSSFASASQLEALIHIDWDVPTDGLLSVNAIDLTDDTAYEVDESLASASYDQDFWSAWSGPSDGLYASMLADADADSDPFSEYY